MQKGTIFDIQPFSVYDGPGIRTTVFLKGCNLRCKWCHNPESWEMVPQLRFYADKCIGCAACVAVCETQAHIFSDKGHVIDRTKCTLCKKCADACCAEALVITGKEMTSDDLFSTIYEDREYYKNGEGGVTFSGGEAMLQCRFLEEVLKMCKEHGIHTAVDTAGDVPPADFERIMPFTDLFLYDIKAVSGDLHRALTGVGNSRIISNLQAIIKAGAEVIIRVPCIPDENWDDMENIAEFLSGLNVKEVQLLAYHRLGEGKREALGMKGEHFRVPSTGQMEDLKRMFTNKGVSTVYRA